jgi:hypothetical protein
LGIRLAKLCPTKEGESVILCFKPTKAVAWDYVLGVKRVIWPLSIFASAERLSSDEKSSVINEGDEAAAVLDWVDIQLEARTQTAPGAAHGFASKRSIDSRLMSGEPR